MARKRQASPETADAPAEKQRAKRVSRKWTKEEETCLLQAVAFYSANGRDDSQNWAEIAKLVSTAMPELGGRTGKQCREKYKNDLRPDIVKEPWQNGEEYIIARSHAKVGNQWSVIAQFLPHRSENAIKNHWNATLRSKQESRIKSFLGCYCRCLLAQDLVPSMAVFHAAMQLYTENYPAEPLESFMVSEEFFAREADIGAKPARVAFPGSRPRRRTKRASRDSSDDTDTDSTEEGSDHECEAHRPKRSRGSTSAVCELAAAPLPFLDPSVAAALAASQLPAIKADLSAIWAPMGFQCPVPETSQPELAFAPIDEPPSQPTWMPQPAPPAQAPPRRPRQVLSEPPATVISVLPVSNTTTVSEPNIAPKDVSAPTTMPPPPPRTTPAIDLVAILGADAAATISLATHLPTPLKLHQEWAKEDQSPFRAFLGSLGAACTPLSCTPNRVWAFGGGDCGVKPAATKGFEQSPPVDLLGLLQTFSEDSMSDFTQVEGDMPLVL